jgi:hypothetical protein
MLYYFNISLNGTEVPDLEGLDLPDLDLVQRHALRLADELAREVPDPGQTTGNVIEVLNPGGHCVFAAAIYPRDRLGT